MVPPGVLVGHFVQDLQLLSRIEIVPLCGLEQLRSDRRRRDHRLLRGRRSRQDLVDVLDAVVAVDFVLNSLRLFKSNFKLVKKVAYHSPKILP